jgi:hypothetical protein
MTKTQFKESIEITVSKELKLFIRSMAASYQFIFKQDRYEFVKRADMIELVELEEVARLAVRFATIPENSKMLLSKLELYQMYTMMELVCRSFLTEIGDEYKTIAMRMNKVDEDRYNSVRSTELKIAETLISQIKNDFKEDPVFDEILERLELLDGTE